MFQTSMMDKLFWAQCRLMIGVAVAHFLCVSSISAEIIKTGNVNPDPSTSTSSTTLYVGQTANGSMTINGGSNVTSGLSYVGYGEGTTGTATITNNGSKWAASSLRVGYRGFGSVTVSDGAALTGSISVGADDTGGGLLTVTGAGSTVSGSFLDVGTWGHGELIIQDGGKVSTTFGDVSVFGSGAATIDGSGSSWEIRSSLSMGFDGPAYLTVTNGASLITGSAYINQAAVERSTVTISGAQTIWNNSGSMSIGSHDGWGELNITQGALVNSGGDMTLGDSSAATGTLNLDNGTLNTGGVIAPIGELRGTGVINTHGLVTDLNLVFDQSNSLQQQFVFNDGATQNITLNLEPTSAGSLGAGYRGLGSLTIADGLTVNSRSGLLGYQSGAVGMGTVEGQGTLWKIAGNLTVGSSGAGTLAVRNGAAVEVGQTTSVRPVASSSITFEQGALTTRSLLAGSPQLLGTGTINAKGIVSDIAIFLDATHPFQQQFVLEGLPNQHITINLDIDGTGIMGAGHGGNGSLTIADAKVLNSPAGYLGYGTGSIGNGMVTGAGSKWNIAGTLSVGLSGTGNLTIADGATVTNSDGRISRGKVVVTGSGALWSNTSSLMVGGFGGSNSAELLVSDGGKVTSAATSTGISNSGIGAEGNGKATIDGSGSVWEHMGSLTVGGFGSGVLIISSGGKLTSSGGALGDDFGSGSSSVMITGAGSQWLNSGSLGVGEGASANLTVVNGGALTSTSGSVGGGFGLGGTSTATITGAGSSWTNSEALTVGNGTTGILMISAGGVVAAKTGVVGGGFGSFGSGSATVTGAGSTWSNAGSLTVGGDQAGSLTVSAGGAVSSTTGAIGKHFGSSNSSTVSVSGAGSSWSMSGPLAVGGYFFTTNTPVAGGTGTLTIGAGGAVQSAGDTTIFFRGRINLQGGALATSAIKFQGSATSAFSWTGGALHVGTFQGNLVNSAGTLAPGLSPGQTTILGNYVQQSAATLEVEIGGPISASQYDVVNIAGATTLAGTLKLSMLNGYLPKYKDKFVVLTSTGSLSGMFSNVGNGQRFYTTDGRSSFLVYYGANSIYNTRQIVLTGFQIPEPSALTFAVLLFIPMMSARHRRVPFTHLVCKDPM